MSIQNLTLIVAGAINLIMSILVFSRGVRHNKVNLYFSLFTFFSFIWSVGLIVINLGISYELTKFMASFIYPVALIIIVGVFYFIVNFPHKLFNVPKVYKTFINLAVLFYSIFCIFFYKLFVWKVLLNPEVVIYYEFWTYSIYSFILISLMLAGILILIYKLKKVENVFKQQIKFVLIAIIFGSVAGSYCNLFSMYFYEMNYNHLGPLFTLIMNFVAFYFIFLKGKQLL